MLPKRTGQLKQLIRLSSSDRAVKSSESSISPDCFMGRNFWFHALKPLVSSNETNGFNL